ncbi:transcription termination/antitermination protein NusA [Candidatus Uhrbacteria bacterium]|nr:transcription termination/antitermination protein NusA [Candidatus Uhrbacteria bacterium]
MASPITLAMKQIAEEKNITFESVLETVQTALAAAFRKDFGNKNQNIQVEFDSEKYDGMTGGIRVFDVKTVVEDMELDEDYFERLEAATAPKKDKPDAPKPAPGTPRPQEGDIPTALEDEFKFNPKTMIMLSDARDLKPDAQVGEEIRVELNVPAAFGRMAAQTAKQVILQKIREAERNVIYSDFKGREGELMNVTVQRREGRIVLIDLGRATGILLPEDQIESERYYPGTRIKALLRQVEMTSRGPEIRLSRTSPGLVSALFQQEIPEILNGTVEIKNIAREAGSRTKVAVTSNDEAVDPIGSCIGQRGTRIQSVIRELGGEKVDVVLWYEDPVEYIKSALSPAKVSSVEQREDEHLAVVSVPADQLSLAIGKGGQNVRLAAKLTGWKITIVETGGKAVADSETGAFAAEESEVETAAESDAKAESAKDEPIEGAANAVMEGYEEQTPVVASDENKAEPESK